MRIVAMKCLQMHEKGKALEPINFMKLKAEDDTDEMTREFLVACPTAVLAVIGKETRSQIDKLLQSIGGMELRLENLIKT